MKNDEVQESQAIGAARGLLYSKGERKKTIAALRTAHGRGDGLIKYQNQSRRVDQNDARTDEQFADVTPKAPGLFLY